MRSARSNIHLTLAINDSDQVRDLVTGEVPVDGVDLTCLLYGPEEIFFRFSRNREWEISELSMAKYTTLRGRGDDSVIAIPVFPSRMFRHGAIYIRHDGPRDDPGALAGTRIGVPEWSVTATVYARALLAHEYGVALPEVRWVQGGTNEPGRVEGLDIDPPPGMSIEPERERSLNEMLLAGDISAMICPHPPAAFQDGSGRIVRLFSDPRALEQDYYGRTGIHPIMHVVVLRSEVYREHPWLAVNLLNAFTAAKDNSLRRAVDTNVPRSPIPWAAEGAAEAGRLLGGDPWPYGLPPNHRTLDAFVTYMQEQGLCRTRLAPEELFAPETLDSFRI